MREALAVLLIVVAGVANAEVFPVGDVFRPLIADPAAPRTFVSVLSLHTDTDRLTIASLGTGVSFGLYRRPGERPGEGWQVSIFGAVFSQFNLDASADDLINTDYRIGVPLTYKRGEVSGRVAIWHQSSHLGDELILNGNAPERVDLSIESVDFVLAWERGGWRPYAGGFYLIRGPEGLHRNGGQAGIDYASQAPLLGSARLVAGLDLKWFEETDWRVGASFKVGLEFGRHHPERRGITVLAEFYDGFSPFGQFYRDDVKAWGLAMQFDF
jgi:hypothetical protein